MNKSLIFLSIINKSNIKKNQNITFRTIIIMRILENVNQMILFTFLRVCF